MIPQPFTRLEFPHEVIYTAADFFGQAYVNSLSLPQKARPWPLAPAQRLETTSQAVAKENLWGRIFRRKK